MTPPIVKRFLISFEQHKLLGAIIFLLSLGVSIVFALQPEPPLPETQYKARGQLSYSSPPPLFTSTGEQLAQQGRFINVDILLAPAVQNRIRSQLQLSNDRLKEIIDRNLKINLPEDGSTQLIGLEYINADTPEEGVTVLGVVMAEMIEQSRLINTSQLRGRIDALNGRLENVQGELATAEEAFYRFISTDGTELLAVQDGSLFSGITGSQQQQRQLQLILEEIEGQIDSIVDQLGLDPDDAYTSAALSADPILASLRGQVLDIENQLKQAKQSLRPDHPTIVTLEKQLRANEELAQERAEEILQGTGDNKPLPSQLRQDSSLDPARQDLANTLVTLQTQREGIIRQLESVRDTEQELRNQYEQFPDRQLQQARLVQEVETKRALYQTILTALVDAQSAEAETTSSYAIAQAPVIEEVPPTAFAGINRFLIITAGAGIGLALAAGVIFLLALLDDRLHTPKELRELFLTREVPILGSIPRIDGRDLNGRELPVIVDRDSSYLTFYERVRSNLRRYSSSATRVVLVASVNDGEGKSVTAYNLAIASAHAGKRTLIIEADLRSRSNSEWVQVKIDDDAVHEPLKYFAQSSEVIRLVPAIANLYLVPSPGPYRQVAAIVESNELQRLIEDARGRFDLVIIDSPSLSKCNDALLLESLTDGVILVARPGISRGSMLGETIDQFTETDIPILGAVINNTEETFVMREPETSEPIEARVESVRS
jgi:capsular exopolysaccharide synthesis family protein